MTEVGYSVYNRQGKRNDIIRYARAAFRHSESEPWRVSVKELDQEPWSLIRMGDVPKYERHSRIIYNRLSRFVISESELTGRLAKANFVESLLGISEYDFKGLQKVVDFDDDGIVINEEELKTFLDVWERDPNGFRTIRMEKFFDRDKAEVILGDTYPLRVHMGIKPLYENFAEREMRDKMEDHDAVVLWNWLKDSLEAGFALGTIPRRNITDDDIILDGIEGELDLDLLFVVTNDKALAAEVARLRGNKPTYRIPVVLWLESRCDYKLFGSPMTWNNVWVDMGSYESVMAQMNIHGVSALTTFGSLKELIVPDVKPGDIKVAPTRAPTDTSGPTAVRFPVHGFPERYRITASDVYHAR